MNAKLLLAVATLAAAGTGFARADEADGSQNGWYPKVGERARAEVLAEAAVIPATRSNEPLGARAWGVLAGSTTDKAVVRAEAIHALRTGQITAGDIQRF